MGAHLRSHLFHLTVEAQVPRLVVQAEAVKDSTHQMVVLRDFPIPVVPQHQDKETTVVAAEQTLVVVAVAPGPQEATALRYPLQVLGATAVTACHRRSRGAPLHGPEAAGAGFLEPTPVASVEPEAEVMAYPTTTLPLQGAL